ncbi:hypothetical protein HA402_009220 [Bradysia odoriphaga]|nr:hypothetical protein HA402_009220 [Bradysia odoriphaga]
MKFKFYCVVIVIAISCLNVTANVDDDETNGCLERYLMQKGTLPSDYPARQPASLIVCSLTTTIYVSFLTRLYEALIESRIKNGADCLKREFQSEGTLDLIIKLNIIEESQLSENEQNVQINETRNEFRQDLTKIARQCDTNEGKFIEVFNEQFGIKNETLSALEHNYCFAKYAADNDLLPLKNVNLNPNDIVTTNIDCEAIIRKERRSQERDVRQKAKEKMENSVNCVMDAYKENDAFNMGIVMRVLQYVELPNETRDAETEKAATKLAEFTITIMVCAMTN